MMYAIFDPATGQILQLSSHQQGEHCIPVDAGLDDAAHYVDGGAIIPMPPKPSPHHVWDWPTKTWVDARGLSDAKAEKWASIRVAAITADQADITIQGVTFKATKDVRTELAQELALFAAEGYGYSLEWERANGNAITLTGQQVLWLMRAISNRSAAIRQAARAKRQAIFNATTLAQVDAVTW